MSLQITVPDTHVRYLSDAVLADRLTRDLLTGLTASSCWTRIAGVELPLERRNARGRLPEWEYPLRTRRATDSVVIRHRDGSIDVHLITGVDVHLYPGGAK